MLNAVFPMVRMLWMKIEGGQTFLLLCYIEQQLLRQDIGVES